MQSASAARTVTNATLTGLTYVDSLISGATLSGLSSISIDSSQVTQAMVTTLESNGYSVVMRSWPDGPANPRYYISW